MALGASVPVAVRRAAKVARSANPIVDAVEALVLMTMMVVLGFSAVYLTIDRTGSEFHGLVTRIDAVYFTVTTLSTVGFGDIVATGQTARVMVTLQIGFDLTLLAIAVRLLTRAATGARHPDG